MVLNLSARNEIIMNIIFKRNCLHQVFKKIATWFKLRHQPHEPVHLESFRKSGLQFQENETHQGISGAFHAQPQPGPSEFSSSCCNSSVVIFLFVITLSIVILAIVTCNVSADSKCVLVLYLKVLLTRSVLVHENSNWHLFNYSIMSYYYYVLMIHPHRWS